MKPHRPIMTIYAKKLSTLEGISGVNCTLYEIDQDTESIKITLEGNRIDYELVRATIEGLGGTVHSVDSVSAGTIVEQVATPQD
ncbi:MAG: DUF211 domain-containing protein [Thermoplasmata archaeon]|nr:DUF211 domain-containing protein [Thermoplasmata archaeon]